MIMASMLSFALQTAAGTGFAGILVAASFGSFPLVPEVCATKAKSIGGGEFQITCPEDSNCEESLCDLTSSEPEGGVYKHWCKCDDGSPSNKCNGYLESHEADPHAPGIDVKCFNTHLCDEGEGCDEEQLTGSFKRLCVCKPI